MKENELAKALLRFDTGLSTQPDPRQQVRDVLRRDRTRIRVLAVLTVILWLSALAGIVALVWLSIIGLAPKLEVMLRDAGPIPQAQYQRAETSVAYIIGKGATILGVCVGVLALAVLGTVLLVFTARRATIRQVNATLIDISEQLKHLRNTNERE